MLQTANLSHRLVPQKFATTFARYVGYKLKNNIQDCYTLLKVTEECSMEEIKAAYFKLAKVYHPDSPSTTADQRKFEQVKEAYKAIKEHRSESLDARMFKIMDEEDLFGDDDDDDKFDVTKLQPQHRPYLEHQGIGYGTPSQRRKQYDQHRVSKAFQDVTKYKIRKITVSVEDNSLVALDKKAARRAKISNSMDRLVEDLIQESMSRGEFDNLSGSGQPLSSDQVNPYTDKITEKLNNIMIDSGVQPEWILLQKEIRMDIHQFRERFAIEKKLLGDGAYTDEMKKQLQHHADKLRKAVEDTNAKIKRFNLLVPIMNKQMMPYSYNKEYVNIFNYTDHYLPQDFDVAFYRCMRSSSSTNIGKIGSGETDWKGVWDDFKGIFKSSKT